MKRASVKSVFITILAVCLVFVLLLLVLKPLLYSIVPAFSEGKSTSSGISGGIKEKSLAASFSSPCDDGIDNDRDGATDMDDFSCIESGGLSERYPLSQCQDQFDNDGDGFTDNITFYEWGDISHLGDNGCSSFQDDDEGDEPPLACPSTTTPSDSGALAVQKTCGKVCETHLKQCPDESWVADTDACSSCRADPPSMVTYVNPQNIPANSFSSPSNDCPIIFDKYHFKPAQQIAGNFNGRPYYTNLENSCIFECLEWEYYGAYYGTYGYQPESWACSDISTATHCGQSIPGPKPGTLSNAGCQFNTDDPSWYYPVLQGNGQGCELSGGTCNADWSGGWDPTAGLSYVCSVPACPHGPPHDPMFGGVNPNQCNNFQCPSGSWVLINDLNNMEEKITNCNYQERVYPAGESELTEDYSGILRGTGIKLKIETASEQTNSITCSFAITNPLNAIVPNSNTISANYEIKLFEGVNQVDSSSGSKNFQCEDNVVVTKTFANSISSTSGAVRCLINVTYSGSGTGEIRVGVFTDYLKDIDKDGSQSYHQIKSTFENNPDVTPEYLAQTLRASSDVDDWPFDDVNIETDINTNAVCLMNYTSYYGILANNSINKNTFYCQNDSNNDGRGDYASCSFCRNPNVTEDADDIDNNGIGHCQAQGARPCNIYVETENINAKTGFAQGLFSDKDGQNSVESGVYGCQGLTNEYGVLDEFCQTTDDNVLYNDGVTCSGYNRSVKWIEIEKDFVPFNSDSACLPIQNSSNIFSFIPGSVSGNAQAGIFIKNPIYKEQLTWTGCPAGSAGCINPERRCIFDGFKLTTRDSFLSSSENIGLSRSTSDLPNQFIDSFRGELNFADAWNNPVFQANLILPSNNAVWQTGCVAKDKCADGVDNDGVENLYEALPYKPYLPKVTTTSKLENGELVKTPVDLAGILNVSLVDVDDPDCKFENPTNPPIDFGSISKYGGNSNTFVVGYDTSQYKMKPYVKVYGQDVPYCQDIDGDGFCGCPTNAFFDADANQCTFDQGNPQYGVNPTNLEAGKGSLISKQFPDCQDGNDIQYTSLYTDPEANAAGLKTAPTIGFGGTLVGKDFTTWHVHPFSPVTQMTCAATERTSAYDFNCNKGGSAGYDMLALQSGGTMFDYSLYTGRDQLSIGTVTSGFLGALSDMGDIRNIHRDETVDAICYTEPYYHEAYVTTATGLGTAAVLAIATGGTSLAIQATLGKIAAQTFGKGLFYVGLAMDAYTAGQLGGTYYGCMDAGTINDPECREKLTQLSWQLGASVVLTGAGKLVDIRMARNTKSGNVVLGAAEASTSNGKPKLLEAGVGKVKEELAHAPTTRQPGCFLNDTEVWMADNTSKLISELKEGDEVLAFDLESNEPIKANLTTFFVRNETSYLIIKYHEVENEN